MAINGSGKMVKARLEDEDGGKKLEFHFNPTEYSVRKSGSWNTAGRSMGTKGGAKPNYLGSNPQSMSLQIFFDDWESGKGDVVKGVEQLLDWCTPSKDSLSKEHPQPPVLKLVWGSNQHLQDHKFYLESVSAKYIMFKPDGTPVRATADISLKEVPTDPPPTNPTSGSIHARRTHVIGQGDTLQSIANREYGKPGLWRGIAVFNDIDDPIRLQLGSRLLLPSLEEAAEQEK
jgi:contractile injection system tube protein